jgi:hypothetical protein
MAAQSIGSVKGGKTYKSYNVKWNSYDKSVYVSYAGWTNIGQAGSASEAMNKAEAWVYNK